MMDPSTQEARFIVTETNYIQRLPFLYRGEGK